MKIKKGDTVLVQAGKDKGKTGKVSKSLPKDGKIIIAGLNVHKKHAKPSRKNTQGGIVDVHAPFEVSNVSIICPRCSKTSRVKYKITGKNKLRICSRCKESLDS